MSKDEAIAFIREARQIHLEWASYQEAEPNWEAEVSSSKVGDAEHHREWVKKYDQILEVLEAV